MSGKEKIKQLKSVLGYYDFMFRAAKIIKEVIISNHKELIQWLNRLPLYYETETQIFVHAGIDEEAGEYWKYGTSDEYFVSKYLATFGKFYKDIIAGHISTSSIVNDKKFYGVFWDKHSHFYLDGNVKNSYDIPMLVYETDEKKYTKISNTLRILEWNINQNVWLDKKTSIDDFIIKEIVDEQKPDIFVLVEAFNLKGEIKELNEKFKGYRLFFADREAVQNTNEVLIGIKTSTNLEFEAKPQIMPQDHKHPNFLRVDVKINKTPLSIIGTRVLCERDKMKRSEQLATLIEYCKSITIPVLILGDFNDHDCYTVKSQNIRAVFIAF
jgi:serine/threonine protein phosphatase 1